MYNLNRITIIVCLFFLITACLTEEQKKVKDRVNKLDGQLDSCQSKLNGFFAGLQNLQTKVNPKMPVNSKSKLEAADTLRMNVISNYFDSIFPVYGDIFHLNPPVQFNKNAVFTQLIPDFTSESHTNLINNIWYLDDQLIWNIFDRIKDDEWHYTIAKPDKWTTDESHIELTDNISDLINILSNCKYILGVENIMLEPTKVIDGKTFESGMLYSKIHVFDVKSNSIVAQFYVFNKNASMVFTDTKNANIQQNDLEINLKQETFLKLKQRFEN